MSLETLLSARPARREDLGAWYAEVLAAADRENRTVPEIAAELGCSPETVYSWRRRLTKGRHADDKPSAGLVRVQVAEREAGPVSRPIEVRTRSGRSVIVPNGFDPSTLAAVVAVLEQC